MGTGHAHEHLPHAAGPGRAAARLCGSDGFRVRPTDRRFYHTDFDTPAPLPEDWGIDAGTWSVANGSYNSSSAAVPATSTIVEYVINPIDPPGTGVYSAVHVPRALA